MMEVEGWGVESERFWRLRLEMDRKYCTVDYGREQ